MLLLTRRIGEVILIGDDIKITIAGINNRRGEPQIIVGIDAPRSISVLRQELSKKGVVNESCKN
jgi:carbon storage regulator